jgi:hypothetical protein
MIVDDPLTRAEVEALFRDYERALVSNDVAALDRFFRDGAGTIRYGVGENLYGIAAIRAFRAARSRGGPGAGVGAHANHHLRPRLRDRRDFVPPRERAGQDRPANAKLGAVP